MEEQMLIKAGSYMRIDKGSNVEFLSITSQIKKSFMVGIFITSEFDLETATLLSNIIVMNENMYYL